MGKNIKVITIPRNAKNGQIVSMDYAKKHPATTTIERRKVIK